MTRKVAAYCRFSTDRQDQRSIDDQARRVRALAANSGFEVVDQ
jgi:DNA invertase Pin-like site-specific DNA recombinase